MDQDRGTSRSVRVLICDDAGAFTVLLAHWLRQDASIEVLEPVADPDESLRVVASEQPDLVVLDHMLGATTSAEMIPRLRAAAPATRIVLISGMPPDVLGQVATESRPDGYLSKASTPEEICTMLHRVADAPSP